MNIIDQINDLTKPPVYVAELSCNHVGNKKIALEFIEVAKQAGADAIKLQTYTPDSLTINSKKPDFTISSNLWSGKNYYELYKLAQTPYEWHQELFEHAKKIGIEIFSTPFSNKDVDFLETFGVYCYKVASFENVHLEFLKYLGSKKKPVIISNGMSTLEEIEIAIQTLKISGCPQVIVLKCCSAYPAPFNEMNLKTIIALREKLTVKVGLSDHSPGHKVPVIATTLGARIIEKHLIVDRKRDASSFDAAFSMEPDEFATMVKKCNFAFTNKTPANDCEGANEILGEVTFGPKPGSKEYSSLAHRRSIYIIKNVNIGDKFTNENIAVIRPGHGLHPHLLNEVLNKKALKSLEIGDRLTVDCFD